MSSRPFRGKESYEAELASRDAVVPFLQSKGFKVLEDKRQERGTSVSQIVYALTPQGEHVAMRVRLCWRKAASWVRQTSAAQLRRSLVDNDWDETLAQLMDRDLRLGVSHALIFQRVANSVDSAALIPIKALGPIWKRQAAVSERLIASGKMGRIRKNHARNGTSPTIWLKDDRTPEAHRVADVLWRWPGVQDLVSLPDKKAALTSRSDDSLDDLTLQDYSDLGSDGAQRTTSERSNVKRDRAVRRKVLERSGGKCERESCTSTQNYPGFIDVHHILRAEISDRVWNCVALCPNCHRDAHFAPNRDALNAELLAYAEQFRRRR